MELIGASQCLQDLNVQGAGDGADGDVGDGVVEGDSIGEGDGVGGDGSEGVGDGDDRDGADDGSDSCEHTNAHTLF